MNRLSIDRQAAVVSALVEGNSIRSVVRMTGVAKNTITKLLVELGEACEDYQVRTIRGLLTERVQADEIWSFVGAKARNVSAERKDDPTIGDVWTWVALDADTKLVITWLVGQRTQLDADLFMMDLASRLTQRIQLTTDAFGAYKRSVERAFGDDIDFAQLRKSIVHERLSDTTTERRYSPAPEYRVVETIIRSGDPDPAHIATSYVERQNLTMRMGMRRYTRLTNGYSKKLENHAAAIALHYMHYNFVRVHHTLGTTPAVAAGIADRAWTVRELCELLQANQQVPVSN
ncbi:MAG: IS1 family transposase [Acidimicrobiia bacterium]